MKYLVIKRFRDKVSLVSYKPGEIYETDDENRGKYLQKAGFVGEKIAEQLPPEPEQEPEPAQPSAPMSLGGGWYQLPDGRKMRKSELEGEANDTT